MGGSRPEVRRSSVGHTLPEGPELEALVRRALGAQPGESLRFLARDRFVGTEAWRIRMANGGVETTFVAKRLSARSSEITALVANRWLPLAGLGQYAAPLLGVSGEDESGSVWHLYEDLGNRTLEYSPGHGSDRLKTAVKQGFLSPQPLEPVIDRAHAAVVALAEVHMRFAGHPLLDECRVLCHALGEDSLGSSVHEATRGLEELGTPAFDLTPEQGAIQRRLLSLLGPLSREVPMRAAEMAALGGTETLLHGDLNGSNVLVYLEQGRWRVRLIDWVHAGVGSFAYDLSNFLLHYRREDRRTILEWYTAAASPTGPWPTDSQWNAIFDTAERARIASSAAWLAATAVETPADWVFQKLAEVESWFRLLDPVLPTGRT